MHSIKHAIDFARLLQHPDGTSEDLGSSRMDVSVCSLSSFITNKGGSKASIILAPLLHDASGKNPKGEATTSVISRQQPPPASLAATTSDGTPGDTNRQSQTTTVANEQRQPYPTVVGPLHLEDDNRTLRYGSTTDIDGWLKTVDQYYVGSNNSIQGACVQNVLDSTIQALLADKNRKFIYVEQAFFQRWWRDQSETTQAIVKLLVNADPFGHSAVQAYLLGAEVGFDSVFFGRIDYQDRAKRKGYKHLEVIWQGSKSLGSSSQIFAGAFPENYEPPPGGFYFEVNDDSPIVQDDINLFDYNVEERVNDFVAAALSQANITRTNHVMWTMGTDFKYQYAESWFRNMDKFIHYVNKDGRVNALYSTPSIYTDAKYAETSSWPLKENDYFPYASDIDAYWTGYFTSRAALKGYVRMLSGYYLVGDMLF
ncbi:hypothetical protein R6Q57_006342 [Mikania cordata]